MPCIARGIRTDHAAGPVQKILLNQKFTALKDNTLVGDRQTPVASGKS